MPRGARVLELGAGTGRLAIPLAQTGLTVTALDASAAMLAQLRAADAEQRVQTIEADMVDGLPPGPFDAVLVAYNTFFSGLLDPERQQACFAGVADRLAPRGSFVIEAFVPEDPPRSGDHVGIRSMTASAVVLSVSRHQPDQQQADGHFVELRDGEPVRLRPWAVRYATPAQLDEMAAVGRALAARPVGGRDRCAVRPPEPASHQRLPRRLDRLTAQGCNGHLGGGPYPGGQHEPDAPQPADRTVGHARRGAGRAAE